MSDSLWALGLYSPWNSPDQNTGVGGLSLLQEIFPTQGSNPGVLHCGRILYQLSHKGSYFSNFWLIAFSPLFLFRKHTVYFSVYFRCLYCLKSYTSHTTSPPHFPVSFFSIGLTAPWHIMYSNYLSAFCLTLYDKPDPEDNNSFLSCFLLCPHSAWWFMTIGWVNK